METKVQSILNRAKEHSGEAQWSRIKHFERFRNQLQTVALFTSDYNKALQQLREILNVN